MPEQETGVAGNRQSAGRYKVFFVAADGREEQILALCDPGSTIGSLREEIGRRILRAGIPVAASRLRLRLDSRTGPLLDDDDPIGCVLLDQAAECVFALDTGMAEPPLVEPESPNGELGCPETGPGSFENQRDEPDRTSGGHIPIKIRVLTPHLARLHRDAREIPVIPATFSSKTTLRHLYEQASDHLSLPAVAEADRQKQAHPECNCSLARAIQQGTLFRTQQEETTANRVLVIHSRNVVDPIECASTEEAAVIREVRMRYRAQPAFDLDTKQLRFFPPAVASSARDPFCDEQAVSEGLGEAERQRGGERDAVPPASPTIVTICSIKRHRRYEPRSESNANLVEPAPLLVLDLHTAESPIKTQDLDLTLGELCLTELAIGGILTVYAVPRQSRSSVIATPSKGKDAIYLHGSQWELPMGQTERGMAMFLSSLRMAVHLISRCEKAERAEAFHDSALHILHVLTRFPPAVRTLHILLDGSVPAPEECAALVQACYEVMVDMMATSILARDRGRTLEGSRLFFSTFLCKTKELALGDEGGSMLPYIVSMKSVHLTNSETMEPIAFPVDTSVGLMEQGCFDALKAGIIRFADDELNRSLEKTVLDGRTKRAALLSGGALSTNIMFDTEIPYASDRYQDNFDEAKILPPGALTNILQHAASSFAAKLQVVAPASLGTAPSPVLTLDRDGFLAVYVGRKPCGAPGRDFTIFRPTRGGECDIDTSIVAQLLEPIIAARVADGTAIFDGEFYAAQRRSDKPDEILMICVDCSASMSEPAGFVDTERAHHDDDDDDVVEEDGLSRPEAEILLDDIRQREIYVGSLNDMKEVLQAHESFDDMVQTVRAGDHWLQRTLSAQIIQRIVELSILELTHKMESLESIRRRVWRDRTGEVRRLEDVVKSLRNRIAGILAHESALSEFLIYRACGVTGPGQPNDWKWSSGDAIPTLGRSGPERAEFASASLDLTVPHELRCPMTQELFREPVSTQDGHTYEAAAIHKWLRIAQTSPLTGLRLSSTQLKTNRPMLLRANNWAEGAEALPASPSKRPFTRRRADLVRVIFVSPLAQFTRAIPPTTSRSALYELAFRGLRGQYPEFSLYHDAALIRPDAETLATLQPTDGFRITIQLPEPATAGTRAVGSATASTTAGAGSDLCLVKVYRRTAWPAFSYWTRTDTDATVGSVLFKTWRHLAETAQIGGGGGDLKDYQVVWHSITYAGDGHMNGQTAPHWGRLSGLLQRQCATGVLKPEPLYAGPADSDQGEDSGESSDEDAALAGTAQQRGPLVLKLYICAPSRTMRRDGAHTSRLSILKQMFDQFVNRILAYGYATHLGLIAFDTKARVAQHLSPAVENFRSTVQELHGRGDTALWDALALARDQVQEYSAAYPNAKKRILCISDGADTSSKTNRGSDLWRLLAVDDILVDSFCLGDDDNADLRTVSHLTNGYKFHPTSLEQAMAICEMEPVLSQLERDVADIAASRQPRSATRRRSASGSVSSLDRFSAARREAGPEVVTQDVFPQRIEHPGLRDSFVELRAVSRRALAETRGDGTHSGSGTASAVASYMRTHRIMNEMQQMAADPHPHIDVYVSERDMFFWKVVVEGPPESMYTGGTFVVYLHMEDTYPSLAPKARFVTPIYHPNVNRHGRICHSILDRNWTTDTTNAMVISTIYGLLMEPDYSDPVNIVVTLDFHHDQVAFADMARDFIRKHAMRTRAERRAEILGS